MTKLPALSRLNRRTQGQRFRVSHALSHQHQANAVAPMPERVSTVSVLTVAATPIFT